MEIFDYLLIYYAKLPFLTNGSCFNKWDCKEWGGVSAGKQTQLGACRGSVLCAVCLGRRLYRRERLQGPTTLGPGSETTRCDLGKSVPASVSPRSSVRTALTFAANFNVHGKPSGP